LRVSDDGGTSTPVAAPVAAPAPKKPAAASPSKNAASAGSSSKSPTASKSSVHQSPSGKPQPKSAKGSSSSGKSDHITLGGTTPSPLLPATPPWTALEPASAITANATGPNSAQTNAENAEAVLAGDKQALKSNQKIVSADKNAATKAALVASRAGRSGNKKAVAQAQATEKAAKAAAAALAPAIATDKGMLKAVQARVNTLKAIAKSAVMTITNTAVPAGDKQGAQAVLTAAKAVVKHNKAIASADMNRWENDTETLENASSPKAIAKAQTAVDNDQTAYNAISETVAANQRTLATLKPLVDQVVAQVNADNKKSDTAFHAAPNTALVIPLGNGKSESADQFINSALAGQPNGGAVWKQGAQTNNLIGQYLGFAGNPAILGNAKLAATQNAYSGQVLAAIETVSEKIETVGGPNAKVLAVPFVYGTTTGGVTETALFQVKNKDGKGSKLIDYRAWTYDDLDDFRHNNDLAVTDKSTLVIARTTPDMKILRDAKGQVETWSGSAHHEGTFAKIERVTDFKKIEGYATLAALAIAAVASVVVTDGADAPLAIELLASGAEIAQGFMSASAVYNGVTSAQDLETLSAHGQSVSLANAQARGDWINVGTTALVVGGQVLGSLANAAKVGKLASAGVTAVDDTDTASSVLDAADDTSHDICPGDSTPQAAGASASGNEAPGAGGAGSSGGGAPEGTGAAASGGAPQGTAAGPGDGPAATDGPDPDSPGPAPKSPEPTLKDLGLHEPSKLAAYLAEKLGPDWLTSNTTLTTVKQLGRLASYGGYEQLGEQLNNVARNWGTMNATQRRAAIFSVGNSLTQTFLGTKIAEGAEEQLGDKIREHFRSEPATGTDPTLPAAVQPVVPETGNRAAAAGPLASTREGPDPPAATAGGRTATHAGGVVRRPAVNNDTPTTGASGQPRVRSRARPGNARGPANRPAIPDPPRVSRNVHETPTEPRRSSVELRSPASSVEPRSYGSSDPRPMPPGSQATNAVAVRPEGARDVDRSTSADFAPGALFPATLDRTEIFATQRGDLARSQTKQSLGQMDGQQSTGDSSTTQVSPDDSAVDPSASNSPSARRAARLRATLKAAAAKAGARVSQRLRAAQRTGSSELGSPPGAKVVQDAVLLDDPAKLPVRAEQPRPSEDRPVTAWGTSASEPPDERPALQTAGRGGGRGAGAGGRGGVGIGGGDGDADDRNGAPGVPAPHVQITTVPPGTWHDSTAVYDDRHPELGMTGTKPRIVWSLQGEEPIGGTAFRKPGVPGLNPGLGPLREAVASKLAELLGVNVPPVDLMLHAQDGPVSVSHMIPGKLVRLGDVYGDGQSDPSLTPAVKEAARKAVPALGSTFALEALVGAGDRHGANFVYSPESNTWHSFDYTLSFNRDFAPGTSTWDSLDSNRSSFGHAIVEHEGVGDPNLPFAPFSDSQRGQAMVRTLAKGIAHDVQPMRTTVGRIEKLDDGTIDEMFAGVSPDFASATDIDAMKAFLKARRDNIRPLLQDWLSSVGLNSHVLDPEDTQPNPSSVSDGPQPPRRPGAEVLSPPSSRPFDLAIPTDLPLRPAGDSWPVDSNYHRLWPAAAPAGTTIDEVLRPTAAIGNYLYFGSLRVHQRIVPEFTEAERYLAQSDHGLNVLYALREAPRSVTVDPTGGKSTYVPGAPQPRTIAWNPDGAQITSEGSRHSAALVLLHEQAHASEHIEFAQRVAVAVDSPNQHYSNDEEARAISFESAAAAQLGLGQRDNHGGVQYNASGPTSVEPTDPAMTNRGQIAKAIQTQIRRAATLGYAAPSAPGRGASSVMRWDGEPHAGPVLILDGRTVAQHLGAGAYQYYDVYDDLHGRVPPQNAARISIESSGDWSAEIDGNSAGGSDASRPQERRGPGMPPSLAAEVADQPGIEGSAATEPFRLETRATLPPRPTGDAWPLDSNFARLWPASAPAGTTMHDLLAPTHEDADYVSFGSVRVAREILPQWIDAQTRLGQSEHGVNALHALRQSRHLVTVDESEGDTRYAVLPSATGEDRTILWNPRRALIANDGSALTPASLLLHEEAHASEHAEFPERYAARGETANLHYSDDEEARAIGFENAAAVQLDEAVRDNYGGVPYDVESPTSVQSSSPALHDAAQLRTAIERQRQRAERLGYMPPPAPAPSESAVLPWDGHEHRGPVLILDGRTIAQHIGAGNYQTYDVYDDLHGRVPAQNVPSVTIDASGEWSTRGAALPTDPSQSGRGVRDERGSVSIPGGERLAKRRAVKQAAGALTAYDVNPQAKRERYLAAQSLLGRALTPNDLRGPLTSADFEHYFGNDGIYGPHVVYTDENGWMPSSWKDAADPHTTTILTKAIAQADPTARNAGYLDAMRAQGRDYLKTSDFGERVPPELDFLGAAGLLGQHGFDLVYTAKDGWTQSSSLSARYKVAAAADAFSRFGDSANVRPYLVDAANALGRALTTKDFRSHLSTDAVSAAERVSGEWPSPDDLRSPASSTSPPRGFAARAKAALKAIPGKLREAYRNPKRDESGSVSLFGRDPGEPVPDPLNLPAINVDGSQRIVVSESGSMRSVTQRTDQQGQGVTAISYDTADGSTHELSFRNVIPDVRGIDVPNRLGSFAANLEPHDRFTLDTDASGKIAYTIASPARALRAANAANAAGDATAYHAHMLDVLTSLGTTALSPSDLRPLLTTPEQLAVHDRVFGDGGVLGPHVVYTAERGGRWMRATPAASPPPKNAANDTGLGRAADWRDRVQIAAALQLRRREAASSGQIVPPAVEDEQAVRPWDGQPHSGPIFIVSDRTVAQYVAPHRQQFNHPYDPEGSHVTRLVPGGYQYYDLYQNLRGRMPPQNDPSVTIDANGDWSAQSAPGATVPAATLDPGAMTPDPAHPAIGSADPATGATSQTGPQHGSSSGGAPASGAAPITLRARTRLFGRSVVAKARDVYRSGNYPRRGLGRTNLPFDKLDEAPKPMKPYSLEGPKFDWISHAAFGASLKPLLKTLRVLRAMPDVIIQSSDLAYHRGEAVGGIAGGGYSDKSRQIQTTKGFMQGDVRRVRQAVKIKSADLKARLLVGFSIPADQRAGPGDAAKHIKKIILLAHGAVDIVCSELTVRKEEVSLKLGAEKIRNDEHLKYGLDDLRRAGVLVGVHNDFGEWVMDQDKLPLAKPGDARFEGQFEMTVALQNKYELTERQVKVLSDPNNKERERLAAYIADPKNGKIRPEGALDITIAHLGLGKNVRITAQHIQRARDFLANPLTSNGSFDLSWLDAFEPYLTEKYDPANAGDNEMIRSLAKLVRDYPDRFKYGTDATGATKPSSHFRSDVAMKELYDLIGPDGDAIFNDGVNGRDVADKFFGRNAENAVRRSRARIEAYARTLVGSSEYKALSKRDKNAFDAYIAGLGTAPTPPPLTGDVRELLPEGGRVSASVGQRSDLATVYAALLSGGGVASYPPGFRSLLDIPSLSVTPSADWPAKEAQVRATLGNTTLLRPGQLTDRIPPPPMLEAADWNQDLPEPFTQAELDAAGAGSWTPEAFEGAGGLHTDLESQLDAAVRTQVTTVIKNAQTARNSERSAGLTRTYRRKLAATVGTAAVGTAVGVEVLSHVPTPVGLAVGGGVFAVRSGLGVYRWAANHHTIHSLDQAYLSELTLKDATKLQERSVAVARAYGRSDDRVAAVSKAWEPLIQRFRDGDFNKTSDPEHTAMVAEYARTLSKARTALGGYTTNLDKTSPRTRLGRILAKISGATYAVNAAGNIAKSVADPRSLLNDA
jgi:hypothetical protein